MILVNKAQCAECDDVIESRHRHDSIWCKCGSIAVGGGREYIKRTGYPSNIIELSEYTTEGERDEPRRNKDICGND